MKKSAALGISRSGGVRRLETGDWRLETGDWRLGGWTPRTSTASSLKPPASKLPTCAPPERDLPLLATIFSQALSPRLKGKS
ncbi:MAG: hypothetical protein ACREYE_25025 [Gammaproteobacteria bacterium]